MAKSVLRWAVPALAVAAIGVATVVPQAVAEPALPARTAEQLLVDLQNPKAEAFSGTVETRSDLGLPALPIGEDSDFAALTSGTHTLRVWHASDDKSRITLIGNNAEASVIRNGTDVWQWSSTTKTAKHAVLADHQRPDKPASTTPTTPQDAAREVLAHIEPTTAVTVDKSARVAGRSAYQLVLDPKSSDTLVAKVTIAVDAETNAPLQVAVWPTGSDKPALQVGFTQVDFRAPDNAVFTFTPPAGVTVEQVDPSNKPAKPAAGERPARPEPTVVGEGWDQVAVMDLPKAPVNQDPATEKSSQEKTAEFQQTLDQLPTVQGPWGSGRVLTSSLFTIVLTDDGRVAVGMVPTERVVAAIPQ